MECYASLMDKKSQTSPNRLAFCAIVWLLLGMRSAVHAESPPLTTLPEVRAAIAFGQSKPQFLAANPAAEPAGMLGRANSEDGTTFWLQRPNSPMHRVTFRAGKLASCKVSWTVDSDETSLGRAKSLIVALTQKYGPPHQLELGKASQTGAVKLIGLQFNLDAFFPAVVALVESSSVETAVHYIWTDALPLNDVLKPYRGILASITNPNRSSEVRVSTSSKDFVAEVLAEGVKPEPDNPPGRTIPDSQITPSSAPSQAPAQSPEPASLPKPITRNWPVWLVAFILIAGLTAWAVMCKSKR